MLWVKAYYTSVFEILSFLGLAKAKWTGKMRHMHFMVSLSSCYVIL